MCSVIFYEHVTTHTTVHTCGTHVCMYVYIYLCIIYL